MTRALPRARFEPAPLGKRKDRPSETTLILSATFFTRFTFQLRPGGLGPSIYAILTNPPLGKRPSGPANGLAPTPHYCKKSLNNLVEKRALDSVFHQALVHSGHVIQAFWCFHPIKKVPNDCRKGGASRWSQPILGKKLFELLAETFYDSVLESFSYFFLVSIRGKPAEARKNTTARN